MPVVTENIDLPGDFDARGAVVDLQLVTTGGEPLDEAYDQDAGVTIAGFYRFAASTTGTWSTTLVGNDDIVPSGTAWRRSVRALTIPSTAVFLDVPTTGGPYRVDEILTTAPASVTDSALSAHASSTSLHGGGTELGYAGLSANFATTSTTYVDITGLSLTMTAPGRPYVLEAWMPLLFQTAGQIADIQLIHSTSTVITADTVRSVSAGQFSSFHLRARIPANTHAPATGSAFTYKLQMKTQTATSLTIFVSFGAPTNVAYLQAYTL